MRDAGFTDITSIDYSASVIAEMRAKTANQSGLRWEVMDVTAMSYSDASWPLVVDKGTLDALYAEDTVELGEVARKMFAEIQRVLKPGGRYVLVTMAQSFVLQRALGAFTVPAWCGTIDIHSFVPGDGTLRPAYLIVFTASSAPSTALGHEQDAHVRLHGELVQDGGARLVSSEQAGAAVARHQRLGALAAAAPSSSATVAMSTAALGGATIAALPVRHDASLFAEVGHQCAADSADDSDSESEGGVGSVALSAETLAALADYAVDSGIVDEVNPHTLVDEIMGHRRNFAANGTDDEESSSEDDSSDDNSAIHGSGAHTTATFAPAPVVNRPEVPAATGMPVAWVTHEDPYVRQLIIESFARRPHWNCKVGGGAGSSGAGIVSTPLGWDEKGAARPVVRFHWGEYEEMDWDEVSLGSVHSCCYCIRKGLIRKAQIAFNAKKWAAKHPHSSFTKSMPETYILQLSVRLFVCAHSHSCRIMRAIKRIATNARICPNCGSQANATDGRASFETTLQAQAPQLLEQLPPNWDESTAPELQQSKSIWIAKPSLTNGGSGLELVTSTGALLTALRASPELREWVVQRYIERPLLVDRRKFHLRVYVLCVGRLKVYVCKDILALFSLREYDSTKLAERDAHITNTCVQNPESPEEERRSVQMWDEVVEEIRKEKGSEAGVAAEAAFEEICKTVSDIFNAVSPEQTTFMALPNCFELFGFDFLLDEVFHPWFLEANAEPDFKQVRSPPTYPVACIADCARSELNVSHMHDCVVFFF